MFTIEKLSEKNLFDVLTVLFPTVQDIKKRTFHYKGRRMIVDYYLEIDNFKFAFEFDGPTHFTRTVTQMRDLDIRDYCIQNDIQLIRFPYFIQIDDATLTAYFGYDFCQQYDLLGKVESEYEHGFIDRGAILPADYNATGVQLYIDHCKFFIRGDVECWSVAQSIFHYAHGMYTMEEFIGLLPDEELEELWYNFPT